jgi:hypothetical protein
MIAHIMNLPLISPIVPHIIYSMISYTPPTSPFSYLCVSEISFTSFLFPYFPSYTPYIIYVSPFPFCFLTLSRHIPSTLSPHSHESVVEVDLGPPGDYSASEGRGTQTGGSKISPHVFLLGAVQSRSVTQCFMLCFMLCSCCDNRALISLSHFFFTIFTPYLSLLCS